MESRNFMDSEVVGCCALTTPKISHNKASSSKPINVSNDFSKCFCIIVPIGVVRGQHPTQ